jgi:DNA transposition AAA+ family ATPase
MNNKTKDSIIEALKIWMSEKGFLPAEFAKQYEFSQSYLSNLLSGKYSFQNGTEKETVIDDKYFRKLAEIIDFNYENKIEWKTRQTPQFMQMMSYLEDARDYGYTTIIIGDTGSGKSYCSDIFRNTDPKNIFIIKVGSEDRVKDLLDKMAEAMKLPIDGTPSKKIRTIIKALLKMKFEGRQPMMIWDESEFMKPATLRNIKEMHDDLFGKVALVVIGTNQLRNNIEKLKNKDTAGMPQFYRRVKYHIKELKQIDTRFQQFLTTLEDKGLVRFLQQECQNYGELHDVLLPAMREAEKLGIPISEDLVRKILNLPRL